MNLNNFLKSYFEKNNITQKLIEKTTGISQSKLSLSLNGKRKLTADELIVIVKIFNIDIIKELNNIN